MRHVNDPLSCTLNQLVAASEGDAKTILDAWVAAKRTELPAAAAAGPSKAHAKLGKAALYKLKSLGVAAPEAAPPSSSPQAPAPSPTEEAGLDGILSSVLGTGDRAAFFGRTLRGGGVEVFQAILNDETGLMQLERSESNRATYRDRLKVVRADDELAVLFAPFPRVRDELRRAYSLNAEAKTVLSEDGQRNVARLSLAEALPLIDPPRPETQDAGLIAKADALHDEPEIAQWMPAKAALEPLTLALEAVRAKALSDDAERAAQLADARAAAAAHFTAPVRKLYARRLWAQAEVYDANQRADAAALARAEARNLFHTEAPSLFGERLFTKVLALQRPKPPPVSVDIGPRPSRPPPSGLAPPPPMPPPRKK